MVEDRTKMEERSFIDLLHRHSNPRNWKCIVT
jgi:hypothetical protein